MHMFFRLMQPFHPTKSHLSMKWFYIELVVLIRITAFTKEALKNQLEERILLKRWFFSKDNGHRKNREHS